MAVCTLALISYGTNHFDSLAIGSSMGVTAFSLLIIVAAFQARSVTASAFTVETFDNRNLNWTAVAELVLAVLITQLEVLRRMFGTVELTLGQWALALVPAVLLIFLWELGQADRPPHHCAGNGGRLSARVPGGAISESSWPPTASARSRSSSGTTAPRARAAPW